MNKYNGPKYREKIVSKMDTIKDAIEDLTEPEMKAVLCAAISTVLINKELCPIAVKQFFADLAVGGIDGTDLAFRIFKRWQDDTN